GHDGNDEIALADGIKNFCRAHDLDAAQPHSFAERAQRRWRKDNLGEAELGAGQLPLVGRAVARRRFVVGVRLLGSPKGFGGAPAPISGAGKRDWIGYARADAGKMLGREPRVVEEAQRDPAGRELLVDPVVLLGGPGGVADDLVGGPEIARV